jgi:hypothetical protein
MTQRYTIANDPIFYVTVAFFALLTTGLPAVVGQPIFLPIVQTLALFAFMMVTLHQGLLRQTYLVVALWLSIQFLVILLATLLVEGRVQLAMPDGFTYRMAYAEWFYSAPGVLRPDSFSAQPVMRVVELLGVTIGSLVSVGLIGVWFLVRALNLAAFTMGSLLHVIDSPGALLGAFPLWTLLRIGGYAGLVILLAEPLLTSNWRLPFYLRERRRLLLIAVTLTLLGLLLELILPGAWRTTFR